MEKRVIIALSVILVALIGIIFIISLLFTNNNKKVNESPLPIGQGEESPVDVFSSLLSIKGIVEGINITQGGYQYMNENSDISNIVEKMRNDLNVTNIKSNADIGNKTFCFSLKDNEGKNLCIDNEHRDILQGFSCENSKLCKAVLIQDPTIKEPETVSDLEEQETSEETVKIVIEETEPVLKQEVTVKDTIIKIYESGEEKMLYINDKEYGPYEQVQIISNEKYWGLLLLYNGSWYVNINGKAKGPYAERPVVEFYGEDLGFSYIKDGKYYVNLSNEIYGPYDDLTEFDINNK